jgi:hypothetical protein
LSAGEGGDFFFERSVFATVTGDEMSGAAAGAGAPGSFAHRRDDLWMAGKPKIIGAAEVDEAPTFDEHLRTIPLDGKRIDRPLPTPQMLAIDLGQRRLER